MTSRIDWPALERSAIAVRRNAHAPYSGYFVGAALVTRSGKMFTGCNVENASYGLCLCAERSAIAQMVAAGERDPIAIVVVTAGPKAGSPCGMCRQTLAEFAMDLPVRLVADGFPHATRTRTLAELLPDAFRGDMLGATATAASEVREDFRPTMEPVSAEAPRKAPARKKSRPSPQPRRR